MAETTLQVEPETQAITALWRKNVPLAIVIVTYLAVWTCTGAHFMADTNVYTQAILRYQHGVRNENYHLTTSNPFWDFGHVLWRPIGWLCFTWTKPVTRFWAHQNQQAEVLFTLFGINFLASLACVILFFLLAKSMIAERWSAVVATIGFFSADAFLNYAHSGNAYVPGLTCLVAGMYVSWSRERSDPGLWRSLAAAVLLGLAVLFWLPYVFVLPAVMFAPLLFCGDDRKQVRSLLLTALTCGILGLAVYTSAAVFAGVRNLADLHDWISSSGHGHVQLRGLRAIAGLAFAVPRSFLYMDRDGMWLKRFLIHDPYAPVTISTLLRLSLWKLALFYAAALAVCLELLRWKRGQMLFALLAATVVPVFVFAVFIFESGSIERYLPLYPFIFLACGFVLAREKAGRSIRGLLVISLAAMAIVNLNAMRLAAVEGRRAEAVSRIADLVPVLSPNSLVLAVNEQDSLAEFRQNFPLDPVNLSARWRTYDVLEINAERLATWRRDLAVRVLDTWSQGGTVWLPSRFLQTDPRPEWNWVEGDDKRIRWSDLPAFFSRFDVGPTVGGEDGFQPLQEDQKDRDIFQSLIGPTFHSAVQ
ncbi:MAG TPA: hypothetical protein VMG31_01855 [Verrucomicrobiae bacterium]|nr:hypothetical protein [Verrucomicrobiae bacterium]